MSLSNKSLSNQTTGNNSDTPRFSITTLENYYTVKILRFAFEKITSNIPFSLYLSVGKFSDPFILFIFTAVV